MWPRQLTSRSASHQTEAAAFDLVGHCEYRFGKGVGVGAHQHVWAVAEDVSCGANLAEVGGVANNVGRRRVTESV